MTANVTFDTRIFDAAARRYIASTNRDLAEIVNQRTLNIAGRAFDFLPPKSPSQARAKIKRYLWERVATRIRPLASGKRKGQFTKKGKAENQLARVHLIVQARRAKAGLKGLYGAKMRKAAGEFARRAQISVGFVKSVLLPIITTLNPMCQHKFAFGKTSQISRWPGSAGYGRVRPAYPNGKPIALFQIGMALFRSGEEPKVQRMLAAAIQRAFDAEGREMQRHVEKKLAQAAKRV